METTTLFFDDQTPHGSYSYMYVGRVTNTRLARALIKFTSLDLSSIHSSLNVNKARVELYDQLHQAVPTNVCCNQFNGSWSGSGSTWNSLSQNTQKNIYDELSNKSVCYSEGVNLNPQHRYKFNIKTAVQRWVDSQCIPTNSSEECFRPYRGLIFKADDDTEGESNIRYRLFASCSADSNRPSLTINYTTTIQNNCMYSRYDPIKYNSPDWTITNCEDRFRYRANCYAYAVGLIYNTKNHLDTHAGGLSDDPLVDPGDFTNSNRISNEVSKLSMQERTLNTVNSVISDGENMYNSGQTSIEDMVVNVTDEIINPNIDQPNFECEADERYIGLVVASNIHFYMRHSDGTWSHKDEFSNITNISLDTILSDKVILTDYNIVDKMAQGNYINGTEFF